MSLGIMPSTRAGTVRVYSPGEIVHLAESRITLRPYCECYAGVSIGYHRRHTNRCGACYPIVLDCNRLTDNYRFQWLYGGVYQLGCEAFDGGYLVSRFVNMGTPSIHVSINFRMNFFGFPAEKEVKV